MRSRWLIRRAAHEAAAIITGSQFSRDSILTTYGIPRERVAVIPNGVDHRRFYPGADGAEIVQARGLESDQYILSTGRLEPRKNYLNLLEAYRLLGSSAPPLVCIGQRDFGYRKLLQLLDEPELQGRVRVLEDVSDEELPALVRHAKIFVYPSYAEGFGMPPLESMASGTPVITSGTSSLPEVVGEAGIVIDPDLPESIAAAMRVLITDDESRDQLVKRGLERAQKFSWDLGASELVGVYRTLLEGL